MKYNWWISDQISIFCCYCTRQKFLFWPKCLEKMFLKCQIIFYRVYIKTHVMIQRYFYFLYLIIYAIFDNFRRSFYCYYVPFSPNCMFWNAIEIFLHIFTSQSTFHSFYLEAITFCNGTSMYIPGLAFPYRTIFEKVYENITWNVFTQTKFRGHQILTEVYPVQAFVWG